MSRHMNTNTSSAVIVAGDSNQVASLGLSDHISVELITTKTQLWSAGWDQPPEQFRYGLRRLLHQYRTVLNLLTGRCLKMAQILRRKTNLSRTLCSSALMQVYPQHQSRIFQSSNHGVTAQRSLCSKPRKQSTGQVKGWSITGARGRTSRRPTTGTDGTLGSTSLTTTYRKCEEKLKP